MMDVPTTYSTCFQTGGAVLSRFFVFLAWMVVFEGGGGGMGKGGVLAEPGCVWSTSEGVFNLMSLANTDGTPRFKDAKGEVGTSDWYYSWNPCFPFTEGTCVNTAVCQTDKSISYYDCGKMNSASLATDSASGLPAIKYTASTDIDRTSHVALKCDESATQPRFEAKGDLSNGDYHFILTSVCACPNGCGGSSEVSVEISIGTVLIIVLLVVSVVYIIGGIAYNRLRHQRGGAELIPNLPFWRALPGLIKDGFRFTCSKLRGGGYDKI